MLYVYKSMGIRTQDGFRQGLLWWSLMGMGASLFLSRAALSITMMVFIAAALLHKEAWTQIRNCFKNPLLLSICLLFFIPFVSGLWSSNRAEWSSVVRIKLPLLLLPLAFAGNWQLSGKQWRQLAAVFLFFVVAGTLWSTFHYVQNWRCCL
jgi:O-antigen ligase